MSQTVPIIKHPPSASKPIACGRSRRVAEQKWFSVKAVAAMFGVSTGTVYSWIDTNGLPALKITHRTTRGRFNIPSTTVRINIDNLNEWVRRRTTAR